MQNIHVYILHGAYDAISTVFLMPHAKYTHVSSSMVREVASLGGSVSEYVPSHVDNALKKKYNNE